VRLEGLGKLKKSTSSGLDPATFRLVAYDLNQLRYRVPRLYHIPSNIFQKFFQLNIPYAILISLLLLTQHTHLNDLNFFYPDLIK
jgi:hypothetical protein